MVRNSSEDIEGLAYCVCELRAPCAGRGVLKFMHSPLERQRLRGRRPCARVQAKNERKAGSRGPLHKTIKGVGRALGFRH